jgi:thiamine-phosphate pyrophosphorylase
MMGAVPLGIKRWGVGLSAWSLDSATTMFDSFTPGALRAVERAELRAGYRQSQVIEPGDLIAGLLDEPESRAATLLEEFGLNAVRLLEALGQPAQITLDASEQMARPVLPQSPEVRSLLSDATLLARSVDRNRPVGTEHLLASLLKVTNWAALFAAAGLDTALLSDRLKDAEKTETEVIPLDPEMPPLELADPGEAVDIGRILDASASRAREGLRVVENYVRFVLNDPGLTRRLKDVRHRMAEALRGFDPELLLASRDVRGDVGTHIMTPSEMARENPRAVLIANFKRTAEAFRTLEEYGKLFDAWVGGRFEVLRYDVYVLEKLVLTAAAARRGLADVRLMVLVGGVPTLGDLTWVVGEALAGGADAIQLREKNLPDREWLSRAREVRILTAQAKARFFVNDRPDLARLAGADGVHLGQHDVSIRDARRIVGPNALIGVSTHDPDQLDKALLEAASYLGVGPVFPSPTKGFADLAGLGFVRHASEATNLPWFAIGGIDAATLDAVLEAGARRVAVCSAVVRADSPRKAAAALKARLDAAWET